MVCKWYRSLARYDKLFEFLSGIFLGKFFFANLIGAVAPYSATIGAQFVKVCRTCMLLSSGGSMHMYSKHSAQGQRLSAPWLIAPCPPTRSRARRSSP